MKINETISYPLLGAVIGFVLVKIQATIGFAEDRLSYILPFVIFGFLLALIRQSTLSNKHKSWLQGLLWFLALFCAVLFLFWNTLTGSTIGYSTYQQAEPNYDYAELGYKPYELDFVLFRYPQDYEVMVDSIGVVKLLSPEKIPWGTEMQAERVYMLSEAETDLRDFDSYASEYANRLHSEAVDFGLQESPMVVGEGTDKSWFLNPNYTLPNYEVQTDTRNGIPVVIEKSNFGSMCGNVYRVTYWLGDGRLASFHADCYGEYPYREDSETIKLITYSFQQK